MIKGCNKIDIIEVLIFRRFFFKIKPKTNTPLLQLTLKLQGGAHLCQQHVLIRITPKSSKIEQQPFYIVTVDQQHISVSSTPKMLKIEYQTSARGFTVCKFWSVEKIVFCQIGNIGTALIYHSHAPLRAAHSETSYYYST